MSLRKDIVLYPDERLRKPCAEISDIDASVKRLAKRMLKDMYAAEGCGLAAPQVGELVQLVVIDVDYSAKKKKNPYVLINPRLLVADGELQTSGEGCLSFPGISVEIERPSHVIMQAYNLDGELMQYEAEKNLLATCLQHEFDHLQGITMLDHLSVSARSQALLAYEEALARGARPGDVATDD